MKMERRLFVPPGRRLLEEERRRRRHENGHESEEGESQGRETEGGRGGGSRAGGRSRGGRDVSDDEETFVGVRHVEEPLANFSRHRSTNRTSVYYSHCHTTAPPFSSREPLNGLSSSCSRSSYRYHVASSSSYSSASHYCHDHRSGPSYTTSSIGQVSDSSKAREGGSELMNEKGGGETHDSSRGGGGGGSVAMKGGGGAERGRKRGRGRCSFHPGGGGIGEGVEPKMYSERLEEEEKARLDEYQHQVDIMLQGRPNQVNAPFNCPAVSSSSSPLHPSSSHTIPAGWRMNHGGGGGWQASYIKLQQAQRLYSLFQCQSTSHHVEEEDEDEEMRGRRRRDNAGKKNFSEDREGEQASASSRPSSSSEEEDRDDRRGHEDRERHRNTRGPERPTNQEKRSQTTSQEISGYPSPSPRSSGRSSLSSSSSSSSGESEQEEEEKDNVKGSFSLSGEKRSLSSGEDSHSNKQRVRAPSSPSPFSSRRGKRKKKREGRPPLSHSSCPSQSSSRSSSGGQPLRDKSHGETKKRSSTTGRHRHREGEGEEEERRGKKDSKKNSSIQTKKGSHGRRGRHQREEEEHEEEEEGERERGGEEERKGCVGVVGESRGNALEETGGEMAMIMNMDEIRVEDLEGIGTKIVLHAGTLASRALLNRLWQKYHQKGIKQFQQMIAEQHANLYRVLHKKRQLLLTPQQNTTTLLPPPPPSQHHGAFLGSCPPLPIPSSSLRSSSFFFNDQTSRGDKSDLKYPDFLQKESALHKGQGCLRRGGAGDFLYGEVQEDKIREIEEAEEDVLARRFYFSDQGHLGLRGGGTQTPCRDVLAMLEEEERQEKMCLVDLEAELLRSIDEAISFYRQLFRSISRAVSNAVSPDRRRRTAVKGEESDPTKNVEEEHMENRSHNVHGEKNEEEEEESKRNIIASQTDDRSLEERKKERRRSGEKEQEGEEACSRRDRGGSKEDLENEKRLNASARRARGDKGVKERSSGRKEGNPVEGGADVSNETTRLELQMERRKQRKSEEGQQSLGLQRGKEGDELDRHQDARMGRRHEHRQQRDNAEEREEKEKNDVLLQRKRCARHLLCLVSTVLGDLQRYREQLDPPPSPFLPPSSPFTTAKKWPGRSVIPQPLSSSLSPPPARLVSPALDESSVSNTERERREDEEGEPRRYHRGARISPPRVQQASSSSTASYDILRSRGDLTRFYLGLFSTEFAPCLRQAFGFYARAIRTFPHDGLVFNQMAMLCTKLHHHSHKSLQQFLGGSAREREAKEGGQGVLFHESKKDGKREDDIFLRWLEYRKTHAASHAVGALYWCLRAHICAFPLRTSDGLLLLLQRLSEEYSSSSSPPPHPPSSSSSFIDERLQQPSPSPSQVKCLSTPLLKATPQKGGFLGMPSSSSSSSSSLRGTTQNVWMEREEVRKKAADLFLTALTDSSSSPQEVFDQTKSSPVSRVFLFLFFQLLYRLQSQTDLSHFHLHANECLRYLRLLISFSGTSSDQDTCTVTQAYPSSSSQDEDGIRRRQERERRRIRDVLVKMLSLESLLLFCLFSSLACALEASRGCRRMQRNISDILHPGRMKERIAQKEEGRRRDGGEESHGKPDGKKKDKKNVQTPAKETEEEEEEERKKEEEGKGRSREKTCTRVDRRRDKTDADTWKKKDQHSSSENLSYPSSHRNSHSKTAEREGKDRESDSKKQRKAGDDKEEEEQQPPPKSLTVEVYRHVPLSLARVSKLAEVVREGYCKRENLSFSSSTSESSALGEVNEKAEVGEVKKEEEGQEKGKEEKREVQAKKTKKKKEKEEEDDDETEQEKEGEEGCSLVVLLSFQLCCDMSTCLVDEAYSIVRTFRRNERSGHLGKLAACLSFLRVEEEEERRSEKEKNQEKDQERKTLDDTKMKKKKKEKKKNDELFLITEERRGSFFTNEEGEEEEDQDENLLIMAAILLGPVCQFLMLLRAHQDLYAFTDFLPIQVLRHQVANVSLLLFPPLLDETRSKKRQSLLLSLLPLQLPHDFVLVGLLDAPLTFPPEWPYQRERVLSLLQTPSPPITQPGKTGDLRHDDGVEEKEKKSLSSASREDQRRGRTEEEEEEKDRCQEEEEKRRERGTSEEIERDKKDLQGKKEEDEDDESEELLLLNRPIFCIPQSSRETVPISSSSSSEEDPRNLHDRKEQQHANTKEGEKEDKTHLHTEVKEEKKGDTQGNLLNDSSSAHLSPKTSAFSSSLSKPSSSSSSPATKSGLGSSRCSPSSSSPHDACSSSSLLFSIYPVISVTEPLPQKGEEEADRGFLLSSLSSPSRTSSSSSSSALTWICVVQFARLWALSVDTPEFRRVYAHAQQYLLQSHHRANLERLKEKRLGKREERILSRKSERTEKREMSGSLEDTSAEVREEVQREEEEEIEERLKISIKRDDPTGEEGEDVSYASNLTTSVLLSTEETSSLGRDVSASSFSRSFLSSSPDEDMPHEDAKDKQDSTAPHHPSLKTHVTSQVTATLLSQINYRWGSTNKKEKQGNLYRTKEETSLSREEPSPLNGEMDKETNYSGSKHVAPVEEEEECDMEKKRKEPQGSPRDTRDDDIYYGFDPRDFVRDEDLHALNLEERGEKKEKDEDGDNSFVPYYYSSRHHRGRRRRPRSRSASSDPSRMDEEEEREREEEEEEERIKKMNEDEIEKRAIQQEEQREEEREESISSMNRRMVAIESSSRDQETTEGKTRRDGDTDSGDEEEEAEEEKKSVKTIEKKRGGILLLPRPPLNLILPSSCRFTSSRTSQNRLTSSSASPPPSGYLDAAQSTIGPTATTTSTTTTSSSSCLPPSPGGLMKSSHYPLPSSSSLCTPSSSGDTSAPFSSVPSEGDPPPQHGSGKNLTTSANRRNRFYFSSRHPSTLHSTVSKTAACSSRPTRQQHHHYQGDQPYYQVVSSHSSSSSLHLPPSNSFSPPSHPSGRLPYPPSTYCSTHHLLLHSPLPHKATPRGPLPPPAPSHVLVSTASSPKTLSSSSSSSSPMLAVQKARGGDPSAQTISSSTGKTAATLTTTTAGGGGGGLVLFSSSMSRKTGISTTTTTVTPQGKASSSSSSFSSSARSTTSFRQSFTQGPLLSSSSSHNSMGRSHEGLGRGHACHKSQQRITLDQGGGIRTIVIDGSNVAMRHGGGKTGGLTKSFSTKGIQQAVDYFRTRGYNVRVFLPDYVLNYESVGEAKRMQKSTFPLKGGLETKIPDSMDVLQQLRKEGLIVATPSQDYDDSYAITYAMNHNGCIVTNDMYRDFIAKSSHIRGVKKWLRSHLISFVFVDDEFIPNPDFRWPQSTLTLTSIAETSVSSSSLSLSASPLPSLPFPSPLSGPSSHPLVVQGEKLEGHETSWAASSSSLYGKTEQDNEEKRREEEGEDEEEEHLGIEVDGEEFMPRLPPPSIPLEDVTRQEEEEEEEDEDEDDD